MARIILVENAFDPLRASCIPVATGTVLREWVASRYPITKEFPVPVVCALNGSPLLRKDWGHRIQDSDAVSFVAVPQGQFALLLVLVVAAIGVALFLPVPDVGAGAPESDPVYSTRGKFNTIRLGEPIEVCYGRNRIYPSLASRPFYRYIDNDQYQYALFCLGQGEYDIEAVQIGDTPVEDFDEIEYEVVPPGGTTTLFATNVYTVSEVGGQTLFGPNEDDYPVDGWVGPFSVCPAGETVDRIEVDFVFPRGLYYMDSKGGLHDGTVSISVHYRKIDDAGNPLGAWVPLIVYDFVATSSSAMRRTLGVGLAGLEGRYEVRARRTNDKSMVTRDSDEIVWEGLRSFVVVEESHDFGDVTLLAVQARATNNLNDRTKQQFNVIATRKLPIYESGGWSEPQTTRSIVWAFVDVFRSTYGAAITEDTFFDLEGLLALDAVYTSRGDYFDWIFRDSSTVWEAARVIAKAGRAIPLVVGSLLTLRRDTPAEIPVALFNQENIVEGSFQWDIKLSSLTDYDSLMMEYTEPSTGYQQEEVLAALPGGTSDRPKSVRLQGVQERAQAYREGMYSLACATYLNENFSFVTGMEGLIPSYGDLIAVSHDVPEWGQAGFVVDVVRAGLFYTVTLSEPLVFESGENQVMFRGKQGELIGPFTAYEEEDPTKVRIQSEDDIDFLLDGTTEPTLFFFGVAGTDIKYLRVVKVEPQGGEQVKITAVVDDARVHSFDSLTPPPLEEAPYPPEIPDLPVVTGLQIAQVVGVSNVVQVSWLAAVGAVEYAVQSSEDGVNWSLRMTTPRTSALFQVFPGSLWVRVAGINTGQGPWAEGTAVVGPLVSIDAAWGNLPSWQASWWQVLQAVGYRVEIYDNTGTSPALRHSEDLAVGDTVYSYTAEDGIADGNVVREMLVKVDPLYFDTETGEITPSGSPVEEEISNAIPTAPTNLAYEISSEESDQVVYRLSWDVPEEDDLIQVKVWVSEVDGFDPSTTAPVVDEAASAPGHENIPTEVLFSVLLGGGGHATRYWRVALFDQWGQELTTNLTAQQTIPAYS